MPTTRGTPATIGEVTLPLETADSSEAIDTDVQGDLQEIDDLVTEHAITRAELAAESAGMTDEDFSIHVGSTAGSLAVGEAAHHAQGYGRSDFAKEWCGANATQCVRLPFVCSAAYAGGNGRPQRPVPHVGPRDAPPHRARTRGE